MRKCWKLAVGHSVKQSFLLFKRGSGSFVRLPPTHPLRLDKQVSRRVLERYLRSYSSKALQAGQLVVGV